MADRENTRKRIQELISILNSASAAYYDEASEIMSNFEYDSLYDELEKLEKESGIVMGNSPTRNVGYTVMSELPKEKHPQRMLSLDKTKDRDALRSWLGDREGLLSWKLDGLTIVLTYQDGKLLKAVTRGNGDIGEVVTENAKVFENVPYSIPYKGNAVIRGEAVIKYADFERINRSVDDADAKYKNPRNLCSGSVRQLNSRITAERNVNFFAFTLSSADGVDFGGSRENQMRWMREQGFDVVDYVRVDGSSLLSEIERYEEKILDFEVPSDGLVLTLEDLNEAASLGTTAKFPRDSLAFKWKDQQAETILREIEWSPSRTGLLNPVAIFDPVELEGTTVRRASVHKINIMEEMELGIGDRITVYKANMIIPQIGENLTRSGHVDIPPSCPVCGGDTEIRTEVGTRILVCLNPDCLAKQVKKFSLFVSRDAMNIEGLSEATLLKFIGKGFIRSFPDIFDLERYRDEIVSMDGFGEKSYDNLIDSIDRARTTTPARLLCSLGIPGIGVATAGVIARACGSSWSRVISLTEEELREINGVGDVMAADFAAFFSDPVNAVMIEKLTGKVHIDEHMEQRGAALEGKTFVITGSLSHFENRRELRAEIEREGGRVTGSVTGSTDFLITNDPNSGSEKNRTAKKLGVAIIGEDEILRMLREAGE